MKVTIFINFGKVKAVYADHDIEVELVDFDSMRESGLGNNERENALAKATSGMKEVSF